MVGKYSGMVMSYYNGSATLCRQVFFRRQIQFPECHHNLFITQPAKSSSFQDTTREGI